MTGILVDTSIVIDFLRQKNKSNTIQLKLERSRISLYISIITHTECFSGESVWTNKEALQALKLLFSGIKILPLKEDISEKVGQIRVQYHKNLADAIIAATAQTYKLTLATLNTKDFQGIKGIKLFKDYQ